MLEAPTDTRDWSRERLLRVLLDPAFGVPGGASLYKVAKAANVAYGWAHRIGQDLLGTGAFEDRKGTHVLVEPRQAFEYWVRHRPARVHADYHVLNALEFLKSIEDDPRMEYAATTYLAENLVQGHLFPRRFDIYIRHSQERAWQEALTERGFPIDSADPGRGTLRLLAAGDGPVEEVSPIQSAPLPPESPVRGVRVVRMPLLIVDLMEEGGPCVEAAEKLMEKTYA